VGYLLAVVHRKKGLVLRALLAPFGLTPAHYAVLARLFEENDLSLQALAERLYRDGPTLSRTLRRMEAAGLIERRADSKDRRRVLHHLAPKGRALIERLRPEVRAWDRALLEALDDAQVAALAEVLRRVLDELDEPPARLSLEVT